MLVSAFSNIPLVLSILSRRTTRGLDQHWFKLNRGILLTSVEFGGKLSLGLNKLVLFIESHFSQLNAELELATLLDLVLVLHIWVHVTKEELLVSLVSEADTHSLVGGEALENQLVVCFDDIV